MEQFPIHELPAAEFPKALLEIPQPPTALNYRGVLPPPELKLLAVVGSRTYTSYGKQVVAHLLDGLRGYPIGIVSGLALGIDSLAHKAALDAGLYTLAVPGGGIDDSVIYPAAHRPLAKRILESGGGLLSEFDPLQKAAAWTFPMRNRIVCGLCPATLLIEAAEKSGTLITARLASDYNREVLVVPGDIFSKNSKGVHQFLKLGATPVTTPADILEVLGINPEETPAGRPSAALPSNLSPEEIALLSILTEPLDRDTLIRSSGLPAQVASAYLMQLELAGYIKEEAGIFRSTF